MTMGEAVAGPTHAHMHRHMHEKKAAQNWQALNWEGMGIDWTSAWAAGQHTSTTVAVPTTTTAVVPATTTAAPAATHTSASSASTGGVFDETPALFGGVVGVSNSRTSFGEVTTPVGEPGDDYIGNVGNPYGANVILVPSRAGYAYTNQFNNTQDTTITVNVWQKVGPDGRPLSGSALAPEQTTLTFTLTPGESKIVAFQENTQVAWAQACSERTASGAFATTYGEANLGTGTGVSGYDVSAIQNSAGNNYAMTITSEEASACTSSMTQNFWLTAELAIGTSDGSCYIAQNTATITTLMGGTV